MALPRQHRLRVGAELPEVVEEHTEVHWYVLAGEEVDELAEGHEHVLEPAVEEASEAEVEANPVLPPQPTLFERSEAEQPRRSTEVEPPGILWDTRHLLRLSPLRHPREENRCHEVGIEVVPPGVGREERASGPEDEGVVRVGQSAPQLGKNCAGFAAIVCATVEVEKRTRERVAGFVGGVWRGRHAGSGSERRWA